MTVTMTIERFEDDFAVLELEQPSGELLYKKLPAAWLPEEAAEGDVICKTDDGYVIDSNATAKRRAAAAERLQAVLDAENV